MTLDVSSADDQAAPPAGSPPGNHPNDTANADDGDSASASPRRGQASEGKNNPSHVLGATEDDDEVGADPGEDAHLQLVQEPDKEAHKAGKQVNLCIKTPINELCGKCIKIAS